MRGTLLRRVVAALVAGALSVSLAGCAGRQLGGDVPEPESLAAETTETAVFYSTGRSLLEERKVVDAADVYAATLRELLRAMPESNPDVAIVQPEAEFNSITLDDEGVLTIDWNAEVLDFEADPQEKRLAFASLLMTFGGFDEVRKLRFTVEGQESGEVNGKDVVVFWGDVSLREQPYDVMRPPSKPSKGEILEEQSAGGE